MTLKQDLGEIGEKEVCELVSCPNCGKKLIQLPKGYPLFDVQCSGCVFRAQVKTPGENFQQGIKIRGSGWDILDKALKVGMIIPPVIINLKKEIRFYPYISKSAITKRLATIKQKNKEPRKYMMFNYDLKDLKYYVLLKKN